MEIGNNVCGVGGGVSGGVAAAVGEAAVGGSKVLLCHLPPEVRPPLLPGRWREREKTRVIGNICTQTRDLI